MLSVYLLNFEAVWSVIEISKHSRRKIPKPMIPMAQRNHVIHKTPHIQIVSDVCESLPHIEAMFCCARVDNNIKGSLLEEVWVVEVNCPVNVVEPVVYVDDAEIAAHCVKDWPGIPHDARFYMPLSRHYDSLWVCIDAAEELKLLWGR